VKARLRNRDLPAAHRLLRVGACAVRANKGSRTAAGPDEHEGYSRSDLSYSESARTLSSLGVLSDPSTTKCLTTASLPAHVIRFEQKKKSAKKESPLTPEMKGFIDRVAVPILVEWYLADLQKQKQIAENAKGMASCE